MLDVIIMKEMKPISPPVRQVMRVITKDGFVKPDSIPVLIDLVRENTKVTRPVPVRSRSLTSRFWKKPKGSWD